MAISLKGRLRAAYDKLKNPVKAEAEVWGTLSRKKREALGRVRFHQMASAAFNDPDQLELTIGGKRLPIEEIHPDILYREADALDAQAEGLHRRAQRLRAEAKRRREAKQA
jgi:hypothetical protein